MGAIGLSLVPVLLVERHITTQQSAAVLSAIRLTLIVGVLSSGWVLDRMGGRFTVLVALLMSAVGLGLLPLASTALFIAVFGMLAQYGDGLIRIAFRVILTDSVPFENHKEALGWMRAANNFGQIISYGVGAVAGLFGIIYLFWFDSITSFIAFGVGLRVLPRPKHPHEVSAIASSSLERQEKLRVFVFCALILCGFTFFYELYMTSTAGRLELIHPGKGLRLFSTCMVINTVICTFLAVPAAKYFRRPSIVFPVGIFCCLIAVVISTFFTQSLLLVWLSAFLISFEEVAMVSLTQFTLIRLTPKSANSTSWYSAGLTLSNLGRIVAAGVAFPWFVQHEIKPGYYLVLFMIWILIAIFCFVVRRALDRAAG